MADKENMAPIRLTRAAAKRAASLPDAPPKRRRVALAELPQLTNAAPVAPRGRKRALPTTAKPSSAVIAKDPISLEPEEEKAAATSVGCVDPQLCAPYDKDIYSYLKSMEAEPKRRPIANYVEKVQKDVTANMRGILVDWLVEVAEEYKLLPDTLYRTISYIDRFLSVNPITRQRLQLLGVSAMLIASKYEEISPPHVEDFCYITDNTYTKQEVVKMESDVLKFLNFEMGNPTVKTFLRKITRCAQEESKQPSLLLDFLVSYLAELSLLDYSLLRFLPSLIAASATFVAKLTIDPNSHPWSERMKDSTGYRASELKECVTAISDLQLKTKMPNLSAIREKYKQHRFKCVSLLPALKQIPASYFEDPE